jgi:hypothetical protein
VEKTIKWFILRGLAAGAAGGLAAALFIRFATERWIGRALLFEDATGIGLPPGEAAEFSRSTQEWGGMAAAVIFGAVMGIVLGVAIAALHHRIRATNELGRAIRVAGAAFVAMVLIPGLKYPPNPPAVGDPDSISNRTVDHLTLMAASVLIVFGAWWLWEKLTEQGIDGAKRFFLGTGALLLAVFVAWSVWPPSPDAISPPNSDAAPALEVADDAPPEVLAAVLATARATEDETLRDPADPDDALDLEGISDPSELAGVPVAISTTELVPHAYATIIWHFRIETFAGLALMWAVMAGVFGLLADRTPKDERVLEPEPEPVAA